VATRVSTRRTRRITKTPFRLRKTPWVDPYPSIPGTEPEKRLFEALMRWRIYFIFQGDLPELQVKDLPVLWQVGYKPDFILPEYRIILDPFGVFHHSQPDSIARDVKKSVIYRALGYTFYHPWWSERGWEWLEIPGSHGLAGRPRLDAQRLKESLRVEEGAGRRGATAPLAPLGTDTLALLGKIPELRSGPRFPLKDPKDVAAKKYPGYRLGKNLGAGANSVAAANRKRKRPPQVGLRAAGRRRQRRRRRA